MRVLALEPYYGGSHKAFLDGWLAGSRHEWTVCKLPAYKWKWRMRHSAVTFAEQVRGLVDSGKSWDVVFCSDMLNLAEFVGLASRAVGKLPAVAYFHENQLTYPVRFESERDYQFAMTNMTTGLAASSVWFNSGFHRDSFLEALEKFLGKMPDCQPMDAVKQIREKAAVFGQGVHKISAKGERSDGEVRILWAGRWEHDKCPEDFFEALKIVKDKGIGFRVSVVGEQFREVPEVFNWAREYFGGHIDRWGYQQSRADYERALLEADLIVSTANHEFFGIGVVEAVLAGAYPVLPKRLAYPEILGLGSVEGSEEFFYDGGVAGLAERLGVLAERVRRKCLWGEGQRLAVQEVERFEWGNVVGVLDEELAKVARMKRE